MKRRSSIAHDFSHSHETPIQVIEPGQWREIHLRSLTTSVALSRYYVKGFISPEAVIDVLNAANVRFLLVGAHMIGGWSNRPRTTEDVDVLVAERHVTSAVRALHGAFPILEVTKTPVVVRFTDPRTAKVVIDVMKANQPLFKNVMRYSHRVDTKRRSYNIPILELAITMKFAAMVSPRRQLDKKYLDAADFISMIKANPIIDVSKLSMLARRVYPGGGKEIVDMVRRVRAGERLNF